MILRARSEERPNVRELMMKAEGQHSEKISQRRTPKGVKIEDCRIEDILGFMSMRVCESKRAGKLGPSVCVLM